MTWRQLNEGVLDELTCTVDGASSRATPVSLWIPEHPVVLILFGHGGSGHRRDSFVLDFVARAAASRFAVLAIEGPCHGDRRNSPPSSRPAQQAEFLDLWRRLGRIDEMVRDWRAALHASTEALSSDLPVALFGLSMGTAYGIPLCAAETRIKAAVVGMWGTDYARGKELSVASTNVSCTVLFNMRWDDEIFGRDGQFALFDSIAAQDKRLHVYPGGHVPPSEEMYAQSFDFLVRALGLGSQQK